MMPNWAAWRSAFRADPSHWILFKKNSEIAAVLPTGTAFDSHLGILPAKRTSRLVFSELPALVIS
jgi:hypothetical protein